MKAYISGAILRYLAKPTARYAPFFAPEPHILREALQPGDILLVEGNTRLSAIIKFLTQSTWSHAALYVGDRRPQGRSSNDDLVLLEADADIGVTLVPIAKYAHFNLRICRPVGIPLEQRYAVIDYALDRIGRAYDSQQIVDLARYLFPYPPVPVWFRRRMLAIGAGDPTKAICSALIAEAFASIRYPILPERLNYKGRVIGVAPFVEREILHIRKSGLYTPRDFDVSPYFQIVKPGLDDGFDFTTLRWAPADQTSAQPLSP
jgi:hypothetical protein